MSAIWGICTTKPEKNMCSIMETMASLFETRCKLDRTQHKILSHAGFSCGLQFITKEAPMELLPIHDKEQKLLFTADCILDNREELLAALHIEDPSTPDGSIAYAAYLNYGLDFLKKLRGLFSIAIYHEDTDTLYIATDPLSQRSLYYYSTKESFCFSTLIDPIRKVHPHIPKNELYLKDFLLAPGMLPNVFPGDTPYQGIYQMLPGHYLTWCNGTLSSHCYWNPQKDLKKHPIKNAATCKKQFIKVYGSCVTSALRTNGETAICLSSGFDSSSVAALASQELQKESKTLYSFTYVPYEHPSNKEMDYFILDETELVKELIKLYPNISAEFLNNEGKHCFEDFDRILEILEIPFKAFVNFPNLFEIYNQARKKGCKVVLNGQFGNSTVSYGDIQTTLYDLYRHKKWFSFYGYLSGYCTKTVPQSRKQALKEMLAYFKHADQCYKQTRELKQEISNPFLTKKILQDYSFSERFEKVADLLKYQDLPELREHRLKSLFSPNPYMFIGAYETKLGLASGVVIRDPTRDLRMLEFCCSVPLEYFTHKGIVRWLMRGAMKDYFPSSYISVWPRYGLQNADWHLRILKDWPTIRKRYEKLLDQNEIPDYFSKSDIEKFLNEVDQALEDSLTDHNELETPLTFLSFLLVAHEFNIKR